MPQSRRPTVGSPERWRAVRLVLNQNRHQLTQAANQLYAGAAHVGTTTLLCREEWVPDRPVPLDQVALAWLTQPPAPAVTGTGDESAHVRPTEGDDRRYPAYADAIAALDPPALFENRPAYRLLAANLAQRAGRGRLDLASGRYFDGVNIGEALAHELADAWHDDLGSIAWRVLPFRELIGDPFDLARRVTIPAVTTLTIRRKNGEASFLLHWRDPAKVTHAGGLYQLVPVGIFQPADANPASVHNDLSLWRCMTREFSEELLGTTEDYRELGSPLGYDRWHFYRQLSAARDAGNLCVHCLGLGIDPLTLAVDILTAAVFDSDTFDALFDGLAGVNAEGRLIRHHAADGLPGVPFTAENVDRFTSGSEPMQSAGAAALQIAWRHRRYLLA